MTQSLDSSLSNSAVGAAALADNADRFGLVWKLRPGTVVGGDDPTAVSVLMDGDDQPVNMISLVGPPISGARVMCEIVPPSGIYIVGYAGQQVQDSSRLMRTVGPIGGQSFSSTSYGNFTLGLMSSFVKRAGYTTLRLALTSGGFAATGAGIYSAQFGVNILGTDYDVNTFFFNTGAEHHAWAGSLEITGVAAGTFDIQVRCKVGTAAKVLTVDNNDLVCLTVTELI